jgi:RNA polymerase sigma factor (sigma-70 family)
MAEYTREAEKDLFQQAQAGDRASVAALMRRHENLVHAVVQQQWSGGWRYADIVHEGRLGLWRAILHYDPERGTAFSTYAWPAIARQVWAAVRRRQAAAETAAPQAPEAPVGEDVAAAVAWQEVCRALREAVQQLPEKERTLIVRHYGLDGWGGVTQQALGDRAGCTRQAIGYHIHKALRRLRHPGWSAHLRARLDLNQRRAYRAALAPSAGGRR